MIGGDEEESPVKITYERQTQEWRRAPSCVEEWPACFSGGYHPTCCRWPKSCSCDEPVCPDVTCSEAGVICDVDNIAWCHEHAALRDRRT